MLYKGFIETKGKKSIEKLKGRTSFKTLEEVENCESYGGVLEEDTILIDLDDGEQAEVLMNIVEEKQMNCKVICTSRGKHFLFKNKNGRVKQNYTHVNLGIGLTADIKLGSKTSYEVLKVDGELRFVEWDSIDEETYDEVPTWLLPIKTSTDFINMGAGDGRNDALFKYILNLSGKGLSVEECRDCIRLMNRYVLKEPLDDRELETILRDDAFQKPIFYEDGSFKFDAFSAYIQSQYHVISLGHQLHIYQDGVYVNGYRQIEAEMIRHIPNLRKTQRKEVLEYLTLICEEKTPSPPENIVFRNGVYNLMSDTLNGFSEDLYIVNKIPWDYNPNAYHELMDKTLDKLACHDESVRKLLEECVGACFYRSAHIGGGKSFILTGEKANGKSTFLDCIKAVLGEENYSVLDLNEMGDRFSTAMMFGKLANIGDDIGDEFLHGSQVAIFKKVVTGNTLKAEFKGQDGFQFSPTLKLLFSANDIPRMKDKTGAVLRRLAIIPFNATFSKNDPDYDPFIINKLTSREAMEYLVRLGVEGLRRILENGYTESERVDREIEEYREENNPIIGFIAEYGSENIKNESTVEVFRQYQIHCQLNNQTPMSKIVFTKTMKKMFGFDVKQTKVNGKNVKVFVDG